MAKSKEKQNKEEITVLLKTNGETHLKVGFKMTNSRSNSFTKLMVLAETNK